MPPNFSPTFWELVDAKHPNHSDEAIRAAVACLRSSTRYASLAIKSHALKAKDGTPVPCNARADWGHSNSPRTHIDRAVLHSPKPLCLLVRSGPLRGPYTVEMFILEPAALKAIEAARAAGHLSWGQSSDSGPNASAGQVAVPRRWLSSLASGDVTVLSPQPVDNGILDEFGA